MFVYTYIKKIIVYRQKYVCVCMSISVHVCVYIYTHVHGWLLLLHLQCHWSLPAMYLWLKNFGFMVEHCLPCEAAGLADSVHVCGFSGPEGLAQFLWEKWLRFGHMVVAFFCYTAKKCKGVSFLIASVGWRIGHGYFLSSSEYMFLAVAPYFQKNASQENEIKFETH